MEITTVLTTTNLVKKYKNYLAVNHVSMSVQKGDIYGFIGKNGAGKTTFIRLLTELIKKSSGSIHFQTGSKVKIGAVIEGPICYPYLSAEDNLYYYAIQKGIKDKNRIKEVLEFIGLTDTGKKEFKDFSLGMRQRLGIGLAILDKPDFLILDEPINGLDPQGIVEIRKIIQRLNQEFGTTILISSHILSELAMVATRYGVINNGKLIKELTKEELENTCGKYLVLETQEQEKSLQLLREKDYQVELKEEKIIIYEDKNKMKKISKLLFENQIYLTNYYYQEENLEDYYLHLIKEGEQK